MEIIKRDGTIEELNIEKIKVAINKAFKSVGQTIPEEELNDILYEIDFWEQMTIEDIQDQIEEILISFDYPNAAKAYILYRKEHERIRNFVKQKQEFIQNYKVTSNAANATIDDNSNVANKNIGTLNSEIHKPDNIQISRVMVMNKLRELFTDFDAKQYIRDLENHIIYKHDESSFAGAIAPYCCSISLYPFLSGGLKHIGGLSAFPQNIDSFCGMYINLIFATSAQFAGAVATSELLIYFNYFAEKEWGIDYYKHANWICRPGKKYLDLLNKTHYWCTTIEELRNHDFGTEEFNKIRDEIVENATRPLTIEELQTAEENIAQGIYNPVKAGDGTRTIGSTITQLFQQVVYSINQPAAARGLQSAFVNFSYFDEAFFHGMFDDFIFPDEKGTRPHWGAVSWLQKYFMQWFNKERLRTVLTFPVESFALVYQNGKFVDEESAKFVAEEYSRGHSFFTYISDTVDSLSSCCRLKNKVQTKEFNFTNGNLGIETGSKSVITLNLNRIIQDYWKTYSTPLTEISCRHIYDTDLSFNAFKHKFKEYLEDILERVLKYHITYNELLWDIHDANLLPVYKAGFIHLDRQYLTFGINGLNQAAEFIGLKCTNNDRYKDFCKYLFKIISNFCDTHNGTYFGHKVTLNVEQVPAESLAIKNYNWDKADGYWVPEDTNLYASYIFKPNDSSTTVLDKLIMHSKRFASNELSGGQAAHINLAEHLTKEQYEKLLTYAAEVGCSYFTFNIPNCECNDCGFIAKQPFEVCPKCGSTHVSLWDRIIGYLTKISNWSEGRQVEQKTRVYEQARI